jgi:hypothetical protein
MAEYYGYVEREKKDYIDWNAVGQDVVAKLDTEAERRVTKKKELADAQQKALNVFDTPNIGENKTLNEVYHNNSNQRKEQQLIWYKALQNNQMQPDEYARLTQNQVDDSKMFTKLTNQSQEKFALTTKRINEGKASQIEIKQMQLLQEFSDLNNTAFRIDPKSGKMIAIKKNKDGSLSKNPNDIMSIQRAFLNLGVEIDEYDLQTNINNDVKKLAKTYKKVIDKGDISTLDDIRQNPEFKEALDAAVLSQLVNPNDVASILTQYGEYDISFDLKDKGKEGIIYVDRSTNIPQAVLTKEQEEDAQAIVRRQYETQIGTTETLKSAPAPFKPDARYYTRKDNKNVLLSIAKLFYATDAVSYDTAKSVLLGYLNKNIKEPRERYSRLERTATGIKVFTIKGGNTLVFPFPQGGTTTDFVESVSTSLGINDTKLARSVGQGISNQTRGVYSNSALKGEDSWSGTALEPKKTNNNSQQGSFQPGGFMTLGNNAPASATGGTTR